MSNKKMFLGILLILLTFSTIFLVNIPTFFFKNDIGKFEKNVDVNLDFLRDEKKPLVLIFFGYVGCPDICIPALKQIDEIYKKIDSSKVSVYFVNLLVTAPPSSVDGYAKMFNENFHGVYINKQQINEVITKLNVLYRPSLTDKNIIEHSGFLHLFTKEDGVFKQKYIYTSSPLDVDFISNDINKILGVIK